MVSSAYFTDDLMRAFLRLAAAEMPAPVDVNAVLRIERRLRDEFGGRRCYVAKMSAADRAERVRGRLQRSTRRANRADVST